MWCDDESLKNNQIVLEGSKFTEEWFEFAKKLLSCFKHKDLVQIEITDDRIGIGII